MKKTESEKLATRHKLQEEQKKAVEELIAELGTVEAAAAFLGVSSNSISSWRAGKTVTKGLIRKKLLDAPGKENKSDLRLARGGGHSLNKTKRTELYEQLVELRLAPPEVRVSTLRALLDKSKLTIAAMARAISIHENTLKDYLNPQYTRLISFANAEKIQNFKHQLENSVSVEHSLEQRLQAALLTLLGKTILDNGFLERDWRRVKVAELIADQTGLHVRTVRRYLPPLQEYPRLPLNIVEAFETAASELGNLLEKASLR